MDKKEILESVKTELYNNVLYLSMMLKEKNITDKKNISESLEIQINLLNKLFENNFNSKELKK
jgi:hypothetical protein